MSSHHLRKEKTCLNCGNTVEQRYCGNCGQENIEPRQTFGHLVAHFFEDLTHYEGKFWGTLRYLFFKPAYLTKEFIAGKRAKYLPPVRLYIFASFIAFLLPAILPEPPSANGDEHRESSVKAAGDTTIATSKHYKDSVELANMPLLSKAIKDTVQKKMREKEEAEEIEGSFSFGTDTGGYYYPGAQRTMHALDSAKAARAHTDEPMDFLEYRFNKKLIEFRRYPPHLQDEMLRNALIHNIPKALFVYMPLFALILSLFHRRRNWIYFDHGIFTLHLFSFVLLAFLSMVLVSYFTEWVAYFFPSDPFDWLSKLVIFGTLIWVPYYLFRAHRKMYGETFVISMFKVWGIIWLNLVLFIAVMIGFVLITFLTLH